MSKHDKSVLRSSITAFFTSFAKVLGFFAALLPALIIFGGIASIKEDFPDKKFDLSMRPDANGKRGFFQHDNTVLEIDIHGIIGMSKLTKEKVSDMLIEAREGSLKDGLVKAILLRINSPGGTVVDSDGIYRLVKEFKEKQNIPVYAFVDGLCASGGMYIASSADKIYASNPSLIGSVGVVLPTFMNFSEPLKNIGIQTMTISEGKDKDQMNPLRPWKEGESNNLKLITSFYYDQFVEIVTSARPKLSKEKLKKEYGAQIYPAQIAKNYGYIDVANSSRNEALLALVQEAGIEESYQVVALDKENWIQDLFESNALFKNGKVEHHIEIPGMIPKELQGQFLYYSL